MFSWVCILNIFFLFLSEPDYTCLASPRLRWIGEFEKSILYPVIGHSLLLLILLVDIEVRVTLLFDTCHFHIQIVTRKFGLKLRNWINLKFINSSGWKPGSNMQTNGSQLSAEVYIFLSLSEQSWNDNL